MIWCRQGRRTAHAYSDFERRRRYRPRTRRAACCAGGLCRLCGDCPGSRQERRQQFADARPPLVPADPGQWLYQPQWHADRLRAPGAQRSVGTDTGHGGVGDQPGRQPGRRRAVLRHGGRRAGRTLPRWYFLRFLVALAPAGQPADRRLYRTQAGRGAQDAGITAANSAQCEYPQLAARAYPRHPVDTPGASRPRCGADQGGQPEGQGRLLDRGGR
ncbi:hypothetical protein D3C84_839980 [compost metagenome]